MKSLYDSLVLKGLIITYPDFLRTIEKNGGLLLMHLGGRDNARENRKKA